MINTFTFYKSENGNSQRSCPSTQTVDQYIVWMESTFEWKQMKHSAYSDRKYWNDVQGEWVYYLTIDILIICFIILKLFVMS